MIRFNLRIPLLIDIFLICKSIDVLSFPTLLENNLYSKQINFTDYNKSQELAIGFWSQCVPQLQQSFNNSNILDFETLQVGTKKQFLFLLKNHIQKEDLIIYYAEFSFEEQYVLNKLTFKKIFRSFNALDYEGQWIFLILNFNFFHNSLTINFDEISANEIPFTQNINELSIVIGGSYNVNILNQNQDQIYSHFKGRLSKPCILDLSNTYDQNYSNLKQKCFISKMNKKENEIIYFFSDLLDLDLNTQYLNKKIISQNGNGYAICGWVKNYYYQYDFQASIQLFRIATSHRYNNINYEGNAIFRFSYLINSFEKNLTQILLQTNLHKVPIFDQLGKYSKMFENKIYSNNSKQIHDAIHKWHYFQYQYKKSFNYGRGTIEIFFFSNQLDLYKQEFGNDEYQGSFLNSDFEFFIGEDIFSGNRFKGQIYQLTFINNLQNFAFDDFQSLQLLFLECNPKCLSCDGPLENDCLTCQKQENSHRVYIIESKQCICQETYIEINFNCVKPFNMKTDQIVVQNKNSSLNLCDFGYFLKPDHFNQFYCYKCPVSSSIEFYCIECLTNPRQWYLHPYCEQKLQQKQDTVGYSFNLQQSHLNEQFIINTDFQLVMKYEILKICDNIEFVCPKFNFTHLGQPIFGVPAEEFFDDQLQQFIIKHGCIRNFNFHFNCYNCQIEGCLICNQYSIFLRCIKCAIGYNLDGQGNCRKCGINCNICELDYELGYFVCKECQKSYFVSINKINCLKNAIDNCEKAIEIQNVEIIENLPRTSIHCLQCEEFFVYIFEKQICIKKINKQCFYGYADYIVQEQVNDWNIVQDSDIQYHLSQIQCLKINEKELKIKDQNYCRIQFENCLYCDITFLILEQTNILICIQCLNGHYWSILQNKCVICNENINHIVCQFQSIQGNFNSPIIYIAYNEQIIAQCDQTCLECEKDFCLICKQNNEKGRKQVSIGNTCIQCPYNCAVCLPRDKGQISQINPLFENKKFMFYSNICLKSYQDINYYFDKTLRTFIQCENFQSECKISYQIILNLYCSKEEYFGDLEQVEEDEKYKFAKQNILFEQLNELSEIFQEEFYEMANKENVRIIELIIISSKPQVCKTNIPLIIQNEFSSNVFSALNVTLNLKFEEVIIFELEQRLIFRNFQSIYIQQLQIKFLENCIPYLIIFESVFLQQIKLNKIDFSFQYQSHNQILIQIQNTEQFEVKMVGILNEFPQNNFTFLQIQRIQEDQFLKISIIQLQEIHCNNCTMIQLEFSYRYYIDIQDITIFKGILKDFVFIKVGDLFKKQYDLRNLTISTIFINKLQIKEAEILGQNFLSIFNFTHFLFSQITNIIIKKSNIYNTYIMLIGHNSSLQNFSISECKFEAEFLLISNKLAQVSQFQYNIVNFNFLNNEYSKLSKFLDIQNFFHQTSVCRINNLFIQNNVLISEEILENMYSLEYSLFYISAQIVEIMNLNIFRSFGINPLSLAFISKLSFKNTIITQLEEFQYLKLHNSFYCLELNESQKNLATSIQLFQISSLIFQNLSIYQVQSLNHPIIFYQSAHPEKEILQETIAFQNISVKQSFTIVEKKDSLVGIIQLHTDQASLISFQDCNFSENILHHHQESVQQQGELISIYASNSQCKILQSNFIKNIIQNSTNSINYLHCQDIIIEDCVFEKNNVFSFELISKYYPLNVVDQETNFQEYLKYQFRIKSLAGSAVLKFNSLKLNRINISISQGIQSAAFSLITQKISQVKILALTFFQLEIIYDSIHQNAGAIYFDCKQSLSIKIDVDNFKASNFYSFCDGGLFYIDNDKILADITFKNMETNDLFSNTGSLLYILNTQKSFAQIKIIQSTSYCTQSGWNYFIQQYFGKWAINREFISNISLTSRSQIYIQFGQLIELNNIIIYGLIQESAFQLQNINQLIIHQTKIFNCSIQQFIVQVTFFSTISPSRIFQQQNASLQINNLQIFDLLQSQIAVNIYCQYNIQFLPTRCEKQLDVTYRVDHVKKCNNKEIKIQSQSGVLMMSGETFRIKINKLTLNNIYCSQCSNGLVSIYFDITLNLLCLQNIIIQNSKCGQLGCMNIINRSQLESENYSKIKNQAQIQLTLSNYLCKNNSATNGTCLYSQNIETKISSSYFLLNNATLAGGSIYIGSNNLVLIENSVISQNLAFFGGGIYLNKSFPSLYDKFHVQITQNQAFFSGQNVFSPPEKLQIIFGQLSWAVSLLQAIVSDSYVVEEYGLQSQQLIFGLQTDVLFYPHGQNISNYKYFDWKNRKYVIPNLNFRLQAITNKQVIVNQLENSYCSIEGRLAKNSSSLFTKNYTNTQIVYYNEITNDFNLDDLAIYFERGQKIELQFNCTCIKVPIYNQIYPYNLIQYNDYLLRIKFQPLECQLGEIFNQNLRVCEVCDSEQGFFNIELKQTECKMKEDISTISVTPAQLQLRQFYWRPYFDAQQISYCINQPLNCKGGWVEGDSSCIDGHIGALCEQCDIYNVRGDGQFSRESQFLCVSCQQGKMLDFIIIFLLCIETFVSILIAAQSNFSSIKNQLQIIRMKLLGLKIIQNINERSILIKMFTNYLQTIGYISSFQLKYSFNIDSIINSSANPTKQFTYKLNCWLSNNFILEIHYLNMVCQLLLPFCYFTIFFALYFVGSLINYFNYSKNLVTTTLIYIYIYFQPILIGGLIQLLSYRRISGFQWIAANVAYRYDQKVHYYWIIQLFLPAFFFLFIFVPFLFFYVLVKNQNQLNKKEIRLKWGYLYTEYNQNAYLWEVLKIVQKELLIAFLSYFEDNIILKSVIASLILLTYLELNIIYKPYFSGKLNQLDFQQANLCFISIILATGINYCQTLSISFFSILLSLILVILNIHFIFVFLINLVNQYLQNKTNISATHQNFVIQCLQKYCPQITKIKFFSRLFLNQRARTEDLLKNFKQHAICVGKQKSKVPSSFQNLKFKMLRVTSDPKSAIKLKKFELDK